MSLRSFLVVSVQALELDEAETYHSLCLARHRVSYSSMCSSVDAT